MRTLFALLPVAGCAAMMLVCARMMVGGHTPTPDAASAENGEVDRLRAEIAELHARLDASGSADHRSDG